MSDNISAGWVRDLAQSDSEFGPFGVGILLLAVWVIRQTHASEFRTLYHLVFRVGVSFPWISSLALKVRHGNRADPDRDPTKG